MGEMQVELDYRKTGIKQKEISIYIYIFPPKNEKKSKHVSLGKKNKPKIYLNMSIAEIQRTSLIQRHPQEVGRWGPQAGIKQKMQQDDRGLAPAKDTIELN